MVKVKRNDGLPPNFDQLPRVLQAILEEEQYKRQTKLSHGYCPGDPRLTSISANGKEAVRSFGKAVEVKDDES